MKEIITAIENRKKEFLLHNIVRIREMIRYLPEKKLDLFREIPFLIHINSPEYPAYVESAGDLFGIWNFQNSGFGKDLIQQNPQVAPLISRSTKDPAVQGLYHIGSLGTFTQSVKSDFDFWVVIDKSRFDTHRLKALHEKLNRIVTYSRKQYAQEVTFFVHDAENLVNNQFDEGDEDDLIAIPKMLIKEEFYRTFIMVTGRIPLWAVIPSQLPPQEIETWREAALKNPEFMDLGILNQLPMDEIQRGLLWQICKAPYDPVKSVIKATVTASYLQSSNHGTESGKLLCDCVKDRFSQSIIDDYAADPYILAFERVLQFSETLGDPGGMAQIKAAIFFRLCGFPMVNAPPLESPKRKILDRYIRQWQLSGKQLKKLLNYQNWTEAEKSLFDQTMLQRLSRLYQRSLPIDEQKRFNGIDDFKPLATPLKKDPDFHILYNKALKVIKKGKDRIPVCSIFLRIKPHKKLILTLRKKNTEKTKEAWLLLSQNRKNTELKIIHSAPYPMQIIGWCFANHLFSRESSQLDNRSSLTLSTSLNRITDFDEIYLTLEPWMPLSDTPFASPPTWEKIVVVLTDYHIQAEEKKEDNGSCQALPRRVEFLARNSWGEFFFETAPLSPAESLEKISRRVANQIMAYHNKKNDIKPNDPAYTVYQLTETLHPRVIQTIKTIVEDTKRLRKNEPFSLTGQSRRPYLDRI